MTTAVQGPLKIFLVAGEESGDRLGAALMRAICACTPGTVEFSGVGGTGMADEGLVSLFPVEEMSIVGFVSVPAKLVRIIRRINQTARAAVREKPDVLVIIDSPDFTQRVARQVRRRAPGIPIVNYVAPQVWAWRSGRARRMRQYIDHVLSLLPFEPEAFRKLDGPPCSFVGHPIGERAASLRPSPQEQGRRSEDPPVIVMMPGSRSIEIERMLPVFKRTLELLRDRTGPLEVAIPVIPHLTDRIAAAIKSWPMPVRLMAAQLEKDAAFRIARAALVKSGTGTLELAVAGVPMIASYRASSIEAAVARRVIKVPSVILANLVLGENVVPEYLQEDATPENLAAALSTLLGDTPERRAQLNAFAKLDDLMEIDSARPSNRAAEIVLRYAQAGRGD